MMASTRLRYEDEEDSPSPPRALSNYEQFCSSQEDIPFSLESEVAEEVVFDPIAIQQMMSLEEYLHSSDFDSDDSDLDTGPHLLLQHPHVHKSASSPDTNGVMGLTKYSESLHGQYMQYNHFHEEETSVEEATAAAFPVYSMSGEVDSEDYKYYSSDSSTEDEDDDEESMEEGGDEEDNVENGWMQTYRYDTELHQAVHDDDLVYVAHFLAVVEDTDPSDIQCYSDSATKMDASVLHFLLDVVHIDVNHGNTPSMLLMPFCQQPETLKLMLANGANIHITDHLGDNVLTTMIKQFHAIDGSGFMTLRRSRFVRSCAMLLDAGMDANCRMKDRTTALFLAVLLEDFPLITLMLQKGIDVLDVFGEEKQSIIMEKIAANHNVAMNGMQLHSSKTQKRCVQVLIAEGNEPSVISLLLEHCPALVNCRNQLGESALILAFRYGRLHYIKLLVEAGITITEEDLDYLDDMPAFEEEDCFMVFDEVCALTRSAFRLNRGVYRYIPDYLTKSFLDASSFIYREQARLATDHNDRVYFDNLLHQAQQLLQTIYNRSRFHRLSCSGDYLKLNMFGQLEWIRHHLTKYQLHCVDTLPDADLRGDFQAALQTVASQLYELKSLYCH